MVVGHDLGAIGGSVNLLVSLRWKKCGLRNDAVRARQIDRLTPAHVDDAPRRRSTEERTDAPHAGPEHSRHTQRVQRTFKHIEVLKSKCSEKIIDLGVKCCVDECFKCNYWCSMRDRRLDDLSSGILPSHFFSNEAYRSVSCNVLDIFPSTSPLACFSPMVTNPRVSACLQYSDMLPAPRSLNHVVAAAAADGSPSGVSDFGTARTGYFSASRRYTCVRRGFDNPSLLSAIMASIKGLKRNRSSSVGAPGLPSEEAVDATSGELFCSCEAFMALLLRAIALC